MKMQACKASPAEANLKKKEGRRLLIQAAFAALLNGYAAGFAKGKIFTGATKGVCVPVLNCYSCPGALGACPIGSLQAVGGARTKSISFYVLGFLMLFGLLFGRLLCGFACPFGLLQDLLTRLPVRKRSVPKAIDRPARKLKYVLLACVLVLPAAVSAAEGSAASPYFCKFFCPAGTLQGGLPLLFANANLRSMAGAIFCWKMAVLVGVLLGAILVPRFFCRYFCPLGAFYSLFSRVSFFRMNFNQSACVGCGKCEESCPMAVAVTCELEGSRECIGCGRCKAVCPCGAIEGGIESPFAARKHSEKTSGFF